MNRRPLLRALAAIMATILLAVSLAGGSLAAPPPVDAELAAKLQTKLDRWRVNHRAPGVAAAIRLPDGSRWVGTSGRRWVGRNGKPVTPRTPFAVASLTKTFMAALILQLRDEGDFRLAAKLSTWMPDYPKADKITLRMLLNHRSGIYDYFDHPRYQAKVFNRPRHVWTTNEILALSGPRYCAPGKCYHYSNTNYILLGKVVRQVTGKSAARNIRERFLGPLGLNETFFQGREPIRKIPAKGYWTAKKGWRGFSDGSRFRPHTSAATVAGAAGAMVSSVRDISDWQDALLSGDVLEPRSLTQMLAFHPQSRYGLGMREAELAGIKGIGHGGSLRGFVSLMYRLPEEGIDVVILTNLGRTSLGGLADKLTRTTLNHLEP